jgi:hypothetical protein
VTAALSHEINNRFAVINEKAGLLQDLAAMLDAGREVDATRFESQSRKIVEQVKLAKQIVGHLNRFAHTVDTESATIDVGDLIGFVAALYARKATAAEVEVQVASSDHPITVTADPFAAATLVGRGLDIALARPGESRIVRIVATAARVGLRIRFEGLAGLDEPVEFPDPEQAIPALLAWCGAGYSSEQQGTVLCLDIPEQEHPVHGRTA